MTTSSQPSSSVARAAQRNRPTPSQDHLQQVRDKASELRDLERERADLEERLQDLGARIIRIYREELPALMDQAGVDVIGVPAKGNLPPIDVKLAPFYSANIAASWPEDRRQKAFAFLIGSKNGDLIKTDVVVSFAKGSVAAATKFAKQAAKQGLAPAVKQTVHNQTLTAWLKEQCQAGRMPSPTDLETLGAFVGRVAVMKERKE